MTVVLDADVVIAALDGDDTSHGAARELIGAWVGAGTLRLISLVNLTEVLVGLVGDPALLRIGRESLRAWSIRSHAPTEAVAVDAARLRAAHAISLPDAYVLATTRHLDASLASFDRRLVKAAGAEGLRVV